MGLELPARALAARAAETELIQFLVATQTPRHDNQLVVVTFDDDSDQITSTPFIHSSGEV
eukprot:gene21653-25883_t